MTRFNGFYKACATCGKEFYVIPSHSSQKYCSRACMAVAYEHAPRKPPKRVSKICLTCGKEFLVIPALTSKKYCSRACMAIAYRRLPPRNCPACGKQFQPDSNMHVVYCSRACFDKVGRQKPKTTKICEQCGITFEVTPCHENKKFCSEKCLHKSLINRITKVCQECGKPFEVTPVHKNSIYCSKACTVKNHSKAMRQYHLNNPTVRQKHPWYTDGSYVDGSGRQKRGPSWAEQKRVARARDNYTCQECGIHESQLPRHLSVHHKIPYHTFASSEEANMLDNLICYCQSCHMKVEHRAKAASLLAVACNENDDPQRPIS